MRIPLAKAVIAVFCLWSLTEAASPRPAAKSDFETARDWLSTWRGGDPAALKGATALPFSFRSNVNGDCEGAFRTSEELLKWAKCARKSETPLISNLDAGAKVYSRTKEKTEDSERIKTFAKEISTRGVWIRAGMTGDGVLFDFLFLIVPSADGARRVGAFLVEGELYE